MSYFSFYLLVAVLTLGVPVWASEEHGHDEQKKTEQPDNHGHGDEHEDEGGVELSETQRDAAQIVVQELQMQQVSDEILAPGEVMVNAYNTVNITPRITAQVIERHVRLGLEVKPGQPLVTLSSVDMAEAQGGLLMAEKEWRRVKKLGRNVVSEKRYIAAQIARQQAYAKVIAFGMTDKQAGALLKTGDVARATGEFDLLATRQGTVIKDDFVVGEVIEPGRVLFVVTDESTLWVEARLTAEDAAKVNIGAIAQVRVRDEWISGTVIQAHHLLDETTRTLALRIEVQNVDDHLHPGLFVDTRIQGGEQKPALAVPANATLRSPDGDWVIFVEEKPDHYKPLEIEIQRTVGEQVVISGVEAGTRVVTQGAFFVQSELAKGGFDIHNH